MRYLKVGAVVVVLAALLLSATTLTSCTRAKVTVSATPHSIPEGNSAAILATVTNGDKPLAGVNVHFSLVGEPSGVQFSSKSARTDASGTAATVLLTSYGSFPGGGLTTFVVKATCKGGWALCTVAVKSRS